MWEPYYLQGIAGKTIKSVQIHSDVAIGTTHKKWLPLMVPPLVLSLFISMDALTRCHATWKKPDFLAFLVGLAKWMPVTLLPWVKMVNTPDIDLNRALKAYALLLQK